MRSKPSVVWKCKTCGALIPETQFYCLNCERPSAPTHPPQAAMSGFGNSSMDPSSLSGGSSLPLSAVTMSQTGMTTAAIVTCGVLGLPFAVLGVYFLAAWIAAERTEWTPAFLMGAVLFGSPGSLLIFVAVLGILTAVPPGQTASRLRRQGTKVLCWVCGAIGFGMCMRAIAAVARIREDEAVLLIVPGILFLIMAILGALWARGRLAR